MTEETRKEQENGEELSQTSPKAPQKGTKTHYWIIAALVLAVVICVVLYVQHLNSPEYILVEEGI